MFMHNIIGKITTTLTHTLKETTLSLWQLTSKICLKVSTPR